MYNPVGVQVVGFEFFTRCTQQRVVFRYVHIPIRSDHAIYLLLRFMSDHVVHLSPFKRILVVRPNLHTLQGCTLFIAVLFPGRTVTLCHFGNGTRHQHATDTNEQRCVVSHTVTVNDFRTLPVRVVIHHIHCT